MAENRLHLEAALRTNFGKGASRQLRREGRVPGVIYGHGLEVVHVHFDAHALFMATKGNHNAVLTLDIDGTKDHALVKDLQVNPLSRQIEHVDLLRVKKGELVAVEVPVVLEGEPVSGLLAAVELLHMPLHVPANEIPAEIVVSVEGREEGQHVFLSDVVLPADCVCELDPETVVVTVSAPAAAPVEEEEAADAE